MRYHAPIFARKHHDGRFTLYLVDPYEPVLAHGGTRAEAEEALREALEARIKDLADPLGVRHRSGRRDEVALTVSSIITTPRDGNTEVFVPRLGLWFDVSSKDEIDAAIRDEVRQELSGASDEEALALLLDAEESLGALVVDAPPRERIRPKKKDPRGDEEGPLARAGADLTATMKRGGPVCAHSREQEVTALLSALAGQPPSSVLLLGPSGVGKTAIVHEAARRISLGEAPPALEKARVFYLSGNRIIAGMRYLGDWEERCVEIVEDARARQAILFVDDLAELCEAGRSDASEAGVARFLAPHVQRGELVLVAESTPERLRRVERIDAAIVSLFRRLPVRELSPEETLEVLRRSSGALARAHGVSFAPAALSACVDLTRRFMPGRRLPGKASALLARVVEERSSKERRNHEDTKTRREARRSDSIDVSRDDVVLELAKQTGLPEVVLRDELPLERDALRAELEESVVEQPHAAAALADAVVLVKTGLNDPKKPAAVYLFVGPTGVGKTESARVLAERLFGSAERLVRFDMSEYQDSQGYLRLAGTEEREGELPKKVREQPFSVILFDEIEKAHESVFDMLLSVLGEGRLVDHGGRAADFRSAIVIMTSNLGSTEPESVGFSREDGRADRFRAAAEAFFRPELLNRIDRIVPFGPLSRAAIETIARRELEVVVAREGLERRGVSVSFSSELVSSLARSGWHPRFGARPLKREVEHRVLTPLARHVVRERHEGGATLELWLEGEEVRVSARDRAPPRTTRGEFYELERPLTKARLALGLSTVRVRVQDVRESWVVRAVAAASEGAAPLARLGAVSALLVSAERYQEEIQRGAPAAEQEELGRKLALIDREATSVELACLIVIARPAPLVSLAISEARSASEPRSAERWLAGELARRAEEKGISLSREEEAKATVLRFADPARASILSVEQGFHDFAIDLG
ncbi:ATP-dependent Clp protease ATP-binding subunit, partial [bacterium]|nr:ATP-dependent Clp protease ATP-binding subunit [bacterium]